MKLTVVTVKQSTSVNLNGLQMKGSRSNEDKRSVRNANSEKNEIAKQCWKTDHSFSWDQKKVVDRESRLIPRKIKETIHS